MPAIEGSFGMCDTGIGFQVASNVRKRKGISVQRFRKELVRVGEYVHEGQQVMLSHEALKHWVLQFSRMKKAGVKVPIQSGSHEDPVLPENNRGWLVDLFMEGDSLFMTCDILGDDAIATAHRSDVSLYAPPTWSDGVGNKYVRPITHVAMVTDPVVPGLSDWVPLAASLSHKKENDMDLEALGKALGLSLKDAKKPDEVLTEAFKKLQGSDEEKGKKLEVTEKEVEALKLSLSKAGKKEPIEPDPTMVGLVATNRKLKLDGLSQGGRLLPSVREGLEKLFVGEENCAIALSLKSQVDDHFDALVELFAENDPVKLGEQTGPQTKGVVKLSNTQADDKPNPLVADAEQRSKEHDKRLQLVR